MMMLSRVAESIFWMARYVERAENIARFVGVTHDLMLDAPLSPAHPWEPLVYVTGDEPWFFENYEAATPESVIDFLAVNPNYPSSIFRSLRAARENARSVRETIASEMWEQINSMYHWYSAQIIQKRHLRETTDFFSELMQQCVLFQGITDTTMTRDLGWQFANLGRQLERADKISRLLDVKYYTLLPSPAHVNSPTDDLQWSSLLQSVSGFEMYRKRHHEISVHNVVDFLVLDRQFPRAIQYCLIEANQSLHAITGCPMGAFQNPAEQALGRVCANLSYIEAPTIVERGLHEFVDDLQRELNLVGNAVGEAFFAQRPVLPDAQPTPDHAPPQGAPSQSQS